MTVESTRIKIGEDQNMELKSDRRINNVLNKLKIKKNSHNESTEDLQSDEVSTEK